MPKVIQFIITSSAEEMGNRVFEGMRSYLDTSEKGSSWKVQLAEMRLDVFSNENYQAGIVPNVRDNHVVLLSTHAPGVHSRLFELFVYIDALRRAKANTISLVTPYFDYIRSDRKNASRVSVGGPMLAGILNYLGVQNMLLVHPHSENTEQAFNPSADVLMLDPLISAYIRDHVLCGNDPNDWVIVHPDVGGAKRSEAMSAWLQLRSVVVEKLRSDHSERPKAKRVIGNVEGKNCIVPDDEILSAGSLREVTTLLLEQGAKSVRACAAHGILSQTGMSDSDFIKMLEDSPIEKIYVCDTVPLAKKLALQTKGKIEVIPATELIGEATGRMVVGDGISPLYDYTRYGF